ncbi:hypothetical protein LJC11_05135, partial [Bacteroidales bacterium OttesenSCG-928-I21]|nr:hypothetical protein [Bacteroidales bacterium OttesenSCG-928-I21]
GGLTASYAFSLTGAERVWDKTRQLPFLIPSSYAGTEITISIQVKYGGFRFGLDDMSVTEFDSYANIVSPSATAYCPGNSSQVAFEYGLIDAIEYEWQYSSDGNSDWSKISSGALSESVGTVSFSFNINNSGYYRVAVTSVAGDYTSANCIFSDPVYLLVKQHIDINKISFTQSSTSPDEVITITTLYDGILTNPKYAWKETANWNYIEGANSASYTIPAVGTNLPASGIVKTLPPIYVEISSDEYCLNGRQPEITITNDRWGEDFKTGTSSRIAKADAEKAYVVSNDGAAYLNDNETKMLYKTYLFTKATVQDESDNYINIADNTGGGYFLQVLTQHDAENSPVEFYKTTIDGLCEKSQYSFTAWTANLRPGFEYHLNFKVVFKNSMGTEVSTESHPVTDILVSAWTQYGFEVTVPAEATQAVFTIESVGKEWAIDTRALALDDIEINLVTPVRITSPEISSIGVLKGKTTTLTGDYLEEYDCGTMTLPLTYQWQISSDNINWANVAGIATEKTYTTEAITDTVYYRLTVTDSNNTTLVSNAVQVVPFNLGTKTYYVCPDNMTDAEIGSNKYIPSLIRLSMPEVGGVGYRWYETEVEGTPLEDLDNYSADRNSMVSDGKTGTISIQNERNTEGVFNDRTYWVEPYDISSGKLLISERIPIYLKQSFVCASNEAVVSPTTYKRLYNEDFGFGEGDISKTPVPGMEYIQRTNTTESIDAGTYKVLKVNESGDGWLKNIKDHVYDVPDAKHGYMVQVNAAAELSQFYTHTLTGLGDCTDIQLVFSAWLTSPLNWWGTDKACLIFILKNPDTGEILSEFITGNLIDNDSGLWRQFAFKFPVPDGLSSVELIVKNNTAGDVGGNDFILDDIEVYLHIPPVKILPAVSGNVCAAEGYGVILEGDYEDDGTLGKNLDFRWEYRANEDAEWTVFTGGDWSSSVKSVKNGSVTRDDSRCQIESFTADDNGQYRLVVGQKGVFGTETNPVTPNYECIAISESRDLTWIDAAPPVAELISDKTAVCIDEEKIIVKNEKETSKYNKFIWLIDGNIIESNDASVIEVPLTASGYHIVNLVAYDSNGCSTTATHEFLVYPEITTWIADKGKKDSEKGEVSRWNDRYNWDNGIPGKCTDVIIANDTITIGGTVLLSHYPVLEDADIETLNSGKDNYDKDQANLISLRKGESELRAACDTITFKMGASVARTDYLNYNFAKVDLDVLPNRWYTLSAPLRDMYSGDYFEEKSYKRQDPITFMRKFNAANPETKEKARVGWSKSFNTLTVNLHTGSGFTIWAADDNEPGQNAEIQSYRFPRDSTEYAMYDYNYNKVDTVKIPGREHRGRFTYESRIDMSGNLPNTNTKDFTTIVKEDEAAYEVTLVGNPFMSYLDFGKFAKANKETISG